jgi:hypothetical protein
VSEFLSPEEEGVLGTLREIVAEVRARGELSELEAVARQLRSAGASQAAFDGLCQAVFSLRGTRFSLSQRHPGGIELSFAPEPP